MSRRRFHRLTTACAVVLSLLLSQLALAGYVCPQHGDAAAMAAMIATGQPCAGLDEQQPALCHEYSADPGKTFETVKLPVLALPAVVQVLERPSAIEALASRASPHASKPPQPPPEPLFLATRRLRV